VKKLLKRVDCQTCQNSLIKLECNDEDKNNLTSVKNLEGLIIPSKSFKTICKESKEYLRCMNQFILIVLEINYTYLLNTL